VTKLKAPASSGAFCFSEQIAMSVVVQVFGRRQRRSPNITPGYWRQDHLTREAFDEEGF
jgi:hypothetical protein